MTYLVRNLRRYDKRVLQQGRARTSRYLEVEPPCWFCPTSQAADTAEHVFPRWSFKYFQETQLHVEPTRLHRGIVPTDQRGQIPLHSLVLKGVCANCNNGWMSRLEAHSQPLISGSVRSLDAAATFTLARWFAKTAIVLNLSQTYPLVWQAEERHQLSNGLPDRLQVSLLRAERDDVNWLQRHPSGMFTPGPVQDSLEPAFHLALTHECRIWIKDVVGVVVHRPWQLSACDVSLPGAPIWDGNSSHPVAIDELPADPDPLFSGMVTMDDKPSAFWSGVPPRSFHANTSPAAPGPGPDRQSDHDGRRTGRHQD